VDSVRKHRPPYFGCVLDSLPTPAQLRAMFFAVLIVDADKSKAQAAVPKCYRRQSRHPPSETHGR
jgi:hypothetical protein